MNNVFSQCILQGPADDNRKRLSPLQQAIRYQCSRIGIQYQQTNDVSEINDASTNDLSNNDLSDQFSYLFNANHFSPIQCTLSAWFDNPSRTGSETVIQAASGLMSIHGRASKQLQPLGLPYLSVLTATLAIQGMMAVAVGNIRGASCRQFSLSMIQAGLLATGQYLAGATVASEPEHFQAGSSSALLRPPFISKDGVVFELETLQPEPWKHFCSQIRVDPRTASQSWKAFLLRYATATSEMPKTLVNAIKQFTYNELCSFCQKSHVYICPQRSLSERVQDNNCKTLWEQGPWSITPSSKIEPSHLPTLTHAKLPLQGITVIESCRRIQGPLAGHLLASLGATVIRLEPPGGDPLRMMPPLANGCSVRFDALNRLKNIRIINIKTTQGKKELKEIVTHAHVFLHNWAPGKAAELELDESDLRRVNPYLIYAYAGGWDFQSQDTSNHSLPGTDFMVQAHSGIADEIAQSSAIRGGSLFTVLDVLGGAVASQAITAALLQRCLTGQGSRVDSSLIGAATLLSAHKIETLLNSKHTETKSKTQSNTQSNHPTSIHSQSPQPASTHSIQTNNNEKTHSHYSHYAGVNTNENNPHHWHIISSSNDGFICIECFSKNQEKVIAKLLGIRLNQSTTNHETATGNITLNNAKTLINAQAPTILSQNSTDYWIKKAHTKGIIACEVSNDLNSLMSMPSVKPCITSGAYCQVNSPWSFK